MMKDSKDSKAAPFQDRELMAEPNQGLNGHAPLYPPGQEAIYAEGLEKGFGGKVEWPGRDYMDFPDTVLKAWARTVFPDERTMKRKLRIVAQIDRVNGCIQFGKLVQLSLAAQISLRGASRDQAERVDVGAARAMGMMGRLGGMFGRRGGNNQGQGYV